MAREIYNITPITEATPVQINRLIVEINSAFANISSQLAKIEGRDGRTPSFSSDIDLGGKRLKNVGRTASKTDAPNVDELVEKALYAIGDRHVTSRLIDAQGGITVPRAELGPDAIPLEQLLEEINIAVGGLITGPASATDNAVARFDSTTGKLIKNSGVIVDDLGNILVPGLVDISSAAAGQVKFPATQNPSINVNTLDDYKEGTWTPGVAFGGGTTGITYTEQAGEYVKIGRWVKFSCRVTLSNKGSSVGVVTVTGLPFTVRNIAGARAAVMIQINTAFAVTMNTPAQGSTNPGATSISLSTVLNGAAVELTNAEFTNTSDFFVAGIYEATA